VDHLESVEHVIVNVDTLRHIIATNPRLKCVERRPMERELVEVPPAEIETFYEWLQGVITGLPAGRVFNGDETGYQNGQTAVSRELLCR
jgi:hypothetical protein